jgi:hypothetical protein
MADEAAISIGDKPCPTHNVILGLEPRIHWRIRAMDGRVEPDHDGGGGW